MRIPRIPQYEARAYVPGFEDKAQELFSKCFGGRVFDRETWNWQFNHNPCLNQRVTTLWDGEILVALTALTPSIAIIEGEEKICAVSGTTMARDDYRGVSIQLVKESGNQNEDIDFKYSFPNKQAFRIATKFYGHRYVGDIASWSLKPFSTTVDDHIKGLTAFDDRHGSLYKSQVDEHYFIKKRDADYLNWRFVKKPGNNYQLFEYFNDVVRGYIVINEYREGNESHLQVIDILADSETVFCELIKFAVNQGQNRGTDIVKLWMTSGKYHEILKTIGFEYGRQPFRMTVWDRDIDLKNAYLTMSDSDVF